MKNVLFAVDHHFHSKIFRHCDLSRIASLGRVLPAPIPAQADRGFLMEHLAEAHIIVSSWDCAMLDEQVLAVAPKLELLAHAGGSVKAVAGEALWARKVRVTGAAPAIAIGVAEFSLGLILTATKRAFWGGVGTKQGQWRQGIEVFHGPQEIYQQNIGVIGASYVGRHLTHLLQAFQCQVMLYDPYVTEEAATAIGARRVDSLEELFRKCMVVSLHAPATGQTHHMIRGKHFRLMQPGALFINTARGSVVHEQEMIEELSRGRFVACLDVTETEPPTEDSPLRSLPNVWLTPHEAGVVAQNLLRIGTLIADEIEAFVHDRPLRHEIGREQLSIMG